jgi:hypothetical protein
MPECRERDAAVGRVPCAQVVTGAGIVRGNLWRLREAARKTFKAGVSMGCRSRNGAPPALVSSMAPACMPNGQVPACEAATGWPLNRSPCFSLQDTEYMGHADALLPLFAVSDSAAALCLPSPRRPPHRCARRLAEPSACPESAAEVACGLWGSAQEVSRVGTAARTTFLPAVQELQVGWETQALCGCDSAASAHCVTSSGAAHAERRLLGCDQIAHVSGGVRVCLRVYEPD